MEEQVIFRGIISGDLNRASSGEITPGIYYYLTGSSISNAPSGAGWGVFVQLGQNLRYYYTQVIIDANIGVVTRKYSGNPAVWGGWK